MHRLNIKVLIGIYFIIRLYGITNPPLESLHNWRQVSVATVARNFYQDDSFNILFPKVDTAGDKVGITGMEFPLLNYFIFITAKIFGYAHWYGRLINLVVSSIGIYYFYLLIKKYIDEKTAFYSTFILLNSLWFLFARKMMPDTFSMSLAIIGLYYGLEFLLYKQSIMNLAIFFILSTMGVLSKIPSLFIFSVLFIPFADKKISGKNKILVGAVFLITMILTYLWYFIWVPYLNTEYGYVEFYMGTGFISGISEIIREYPDFFKKFYYNSIRYVGFILFIYGLFKAIKTDNRLLLNISWITFATFMVFVFKAGYNFPHHIYYVIPFVPVMALIAGYGLSRINSRIIVALFIIGILLECLPRSQVRRDFRVANDVYRLGLEDVLKSRIEKGALIAINGGLNPRDMYFANRKGWSIRNEDITDQNLDGMKRKGCKYLVINKHYMDDKLNDRMKTVNLEKIHDDVSYVIFRM